MATAIALFVLSAAVTVMVNGVPIESQHEPLIITTEIPKLDGDSFNSMVGGCKYKDLIYRIAKDMRKFYLSFRTDKTTSCRKRFERLEKVYMREFEFCFKMVYSGATLAAVMEKYKGSLDFSRKHHCGEIKYDIGDILKQHPTKECPAGFIGNVNECFHGYHKMFKKNPGDLNLCKEFYDNKLCLKREIAKCSFDFSKSSWIFDNELNTFCDKRQLKMLGSQGQ